MTKRIADPTREVWREENERLTQEFLDRGGKVTVYDPQIVCVPSKQFWADRGGCYTPWNEVHGWMEHPKFTIAGEQLGNGGYLHKPHKMLG